MWWDTTRRSLILARTLSQIIVSSGDIGANSWQAEYLWLLIVISFWPDFISVYHFFCDCSLFVSWISDWETDIEFDKIVVKVTGKESFALISKSTRGEMTCSELCIRSAWGYCFIFSLANCLLSAWIFSILPCLLVQFFGTFFTLALYLLPLPTLLVLGPSLSPVNVQSLIHVYTS